MLLFNVQRGISVPCGRLDGAGGSDRRRATSTPSTTSATASVGPSTDRLGPILRDGWLIQAVRIRGVTYAELWAWASHRSGCGTGQPRGPIACGRRTRRAGELPQRRGSAEGATPPRNLSGTRTARAGNAGKQVVRHLTDGASPSGVKLSGPMTAGRSTGATEDPDARRTDARPPSPPDRPTGRRRPSPTATSAPTPDEQAEMLAALGYDSLDELVAACGARPPSGRPSRSTCPRPRPRRPRLPSCRRWPRATGSSRPMIGLGYHGTVTPAVIRRNVLENPAWYTAYTPYQPEISQGRLEALLDFQTMVADLSGHGPGQRLAARRGHGGRRGDDACRRASKAPDGAAFVVDAGQPPADHRGGAHPGGAARHRRGRGAGRGTDGSVSLPDGECSACSSRTPSSTGARARPRRAGGRGARPGRPGHRGRRSARAVPAAPTGRGRAPTSWSAPPSASACRSATAGRTPATWRCGRACSARCPGGWSGVSVDADGDPAYRLALQTREQHIRREKATSNICTAQVLLAVVAAMYAVYHGPEGLRSIASAVHGKACRLAAGAAGRRGRGGPRRVLRHGGRAGPGPGGGGRGRRPRSGRQPPPGRRRHRRRRVRRDHHRRPPGRGVHGLRGRPGRCRRGSTATLARPTRRSPLPCAARREMLTHPTFHRYRSETAMLRYLRRLADKDVALDRSMIPLGSCTMKLNATTEMEPISWPGFAGMHPFAPVDQALGYASLIDDLERLARRDHRVRRRVAPAQRRLPGRARRPAGDPGVPPQPATTSAGTCASSRPPRTAPTPRRAVMAGMRVVVVACDDAGNVDLDDLRAKLDGAPGRVAALMVTYPSTHGVFEEAIEALCDLVHEAGGQVYLDGANLNAMVGLARPGRFGADVSHLNLHKTFCIPHGGGGPGVGPIGVRAHLAPFLPNHPLVPSAGPATGPGPISAAPWGSAGILPIPWAYIRMMGPDGPAPGDRGGDPQRQLRRPPAARPLPGAVRGPQRAGGPRVHPRPAAAHEGDRHHRGRRRQAAGRLRHPRPDDELPGGRHADGRADRVGGPGRARPVLRGDDRHPGRGRRASPTCCATPPTRPPASWRRTGRSPTPGTRPPTRSRRLRLAKYWPPVRRIDGGYGDRNLFCSCPPLDP